MPDRDLALRARGEDRTAVGPPHRPLRLRKPISLITLAACVAALAIPDVATARAKQQCSVAPGSLHSHWSWRIIDERKCWYEGQPKLSKSLLEWPARAKAAPHPRREVARVPAVKADDDLDAQAYAPADPASFESLWQDRIEKH